MSQIKIKTLGLVYVDESTAKQIDAMMSNEETRKQNPFLRTKKWSGYLSEVQGILHENEGKNLSGDKVQKGIEEYNAWRKKFLAQTLESKGKDVQIFTLLYQAIVCKFTEKPSQELIDEAIQVQTDFFKQNKLRCFCDLHLLTEVLKKYKQNSKLVGICSSAIFRILERQVVEDMVCAKYNH